MRLKKKSKVYGKVTLENTSAVSYKAKYVFTIWPSHPTPGILPKRNENLHSHQNLYVNVYTGWICNRPKLGTTLTPFS